MKLIVANWKMYLGVKQATHLAERIRRALPRPRARVVLCPSFPALMPVGAVIRRSPYALGAQDVAWEERGAFTGEVSARDLRELGCAYVIVGHSERRQKLGETDEMVRRKLEAAVHARLKPILCVGETLTHRRAGKATSIICRELKAALQNLQLTTDNVQLTIAYEPIWAIGTGVSATPRDVVTMHRLIRAEAERLLGRRARVRVIYGGSVDSRTAGAFLREPEVHGVLVGGASARLSFVRIIQRASL